MQAAEVGEGAALNALGFAGAVEKDECYRDDDVVDQACSRGQYTFFYKMTWNESWKLTSSRDETGKPSNDNGGTVGNLQEGQDRENHDDTEAVDGHTLAGGVCQDAWGPSLQRETIQSTDSTIGISVTSREDGSQQ